MTSRLAHALGRMGVTTENYFGDLALQPIDPRNDAIAKYLMEMGDESRMPIIHPNAVGYDQPPGELFPIDEFMMPDDYEEPTSPAERRGMEEDEEALAADTADKEQALLDFWDWLDEMQDVPLPRPRPRGAPRR